MPLTYSNSIAKIILFMMAIATNQLFAAVIPKDFPKELLYKEHPIDSLCIEEFSEQTFISKLNHCGVDSEPNRHITGADKNLIQKGYVGFDYSWSIDSSVSHGYSYYKPFGSFDNKTLVYTINSGGGSGDFTSLSLIKRNQDEIEVTRLEGGDRCNNGIVDVTRGNANHVLYNVNLTAYDFLILANANPHHLEAYKDLDSCAACCRATALFELNPIQQDKKLLTIDLEAYPTENNSSSTYQMCFDNLVEEYKKKGIKKLNASALKTFVELFNSTCVKK